MHMLALPDPITNRLNDLMKRFNCEFTKTTITSSDESSAPAGMSGLILSISSGDFLAGSLFIGWGPHAERNVFEQVVIQLEKTWDEQLEVCRCIAQALRAVGR